MKILFLTCLFLLFTFAAVGQSELPVIGKIDDIKSFRKVYIAADSTKDRELILKALKKKKAKLEVVGDPKDAEFFLEFKTLSRQNKTELVGGSYTENGEMTAYYYSADKKKTIAWSETKLYYEASGMMVESPNSYALARRFVNALTGKD